jgi:DNA polymerase elongation subunit (family B)
MKVLDVDIECMPNKGYFFGNNPRFIPHANIEESSRMLSYAWRWRGQREIGFASEWTHSDAEFLGTIHRLLSEADAVITYNGNNFDLKVLNKEFLVAGMTPPSPYATIDLYRVVKRKFRFTHNSLQAVCSELGIGKKIPHNGIDLWIDTGAGEPAARRLMERYNKHDVRLMRPLYERLLPWIDNHPNHALYVDTDRPVCPNCGSTHLVKNKVHRTQTQIYQRYHCQSCGKYPRGRNTLVPQEDRQRILMGVNA